MNISVVIPTYNRYEFLKRALDSVYAQSNLPSEVIVVDDGSSDDTSQIVQDFPQIKYIYQKNSGVSSARNTGIKNSASEWIAFLDSDDEWDIDKLKEQVSFHKNNSEILMSYTDEKWIRNGVQVKLPKKYKKYGGDIFNECLSHCIIAPSSVMIHKSLFDKVGVFDEGLEVCEDYDLWLRILLEHKVGLVDKKLIIKYAGHEHQLSFKYWGMDRFRVKALEKLFNEIPSQAGNDGVCQAWNDDLLAGDEDFHHACTRPFRHPQALPFRHPRARPGDLIVQTLLRKYRVLLKGAIKYDRISEIKDYKEKIQFYEQLN